jgi:hypothetical protein
MSLAPVPAEISASVDGGRLAGLVGYPPQVPLAGRALALAGEARRWYSRNGGPWTRTRALAIVACGDAQVGLAEGVVLRSPLLASRLRRCQPRELVIAAVSAGAAIDRRVESLWADERPDEAFFLDRFGAAVAERLAAGVGRELHRQARRRGLGVLPAMSPGCEGWGLGGQTVLANCLRAAEGAVSDEGLVVYDTGALQPKSSLLAVFAVASRLPAGWDRVDDCSWCSLSSCRLRRKRSALAEGESQ